MDVTNNLEDTLHAVCRRHLPACAILLVAVATTPCRGAAQEASGILQSASAPEVWADGADLKDPSRARLLSTTATLVPLAVAGAVATIPRGRSQARDVVSGILATAGLLAGPSAGSIYADNWSRARRGMLIRTGGGALALAGVTVLAASAFGGGDDRMGVAGHLVFGSGAAVVVGSAVYDIVRSSVRSVEEHNEAVRTSRSVSVTPWMPGEGGAGLQVRISF